MTLLTFFLTLVVIGVLYYLVVTYLPLPDIIKTVLNIVLVVLVICLLGALFGLFGLPFRLK